MSELSWSEPIVAFACSAARVADLKPLVVPPWAAVTVYLNVWEGPPKPNWVVLVESNTLRRSFKCLISD